MNPLKIQGMVVYECVCKISILLHRFMQWCTLRLFPYLGYVNNNATVNKRVQISLGDLVFFALDIYLEMALVNHVVVLFSFYFLKNFHNVFHKLLCQLRLPPIVQRVLFLPYTCLHLLSLVILMIFILAGVR